MRHDIIVTYRLLPQFEITICPALQKKPETQSVNAISAPVQSDPFAPPYNPQLHIGDIRDGETMDEYVVLVHIHHNVRSRHLTPEQAEQIFRRTPAFYPRYER